jgi:hypothetical protein
MLEIKKSVLAVKIDGKEYSIKFPTIKTVREFQLKVKESGEQDLGVTLDFLASLGLPVAVSEELEPQHLQAIIEAISGTKKN